MCKSHPIFIFRKLISGGTRKKIFLILATLFPLVSAAQDYCVSDHELFIMPTAYTMPANTSYFTDYELFIINYGYAISPRTHVSVLSLFPITSDFVESFTVGVKQNFLKSNGLNAALWGTITPKIAGYTVGTVFSLGKIEKSFHIGIGVIGDDELGRAAIAFMFGAHLKASKKVAWIIEYENFKRGIEVGFKGIITLGARFRGKSVSFDFGGLRPLENSGDLFLLPFLKGTVWFN